MTWYEHAMLRYASQAFAVLGLEDWFKVMSMELAILLMLLDCVIYV